MQQIEARTLRKVSARLIPFLMICYFVAYLDRVNVGFAAITMKSDLGLTATMFGLGSGIFFLGYVLFEVPSNLVLYRVGARRWIARIMVTWGILSAAMAFIPQIAAATGLSNAHTFYLLRLLLGVAEAGFFPAVIFYLTLWFPSAYRARIIGLFMAAIPISLAIGSPLSGTILGLDGAWGFAGWQWLFILEAVPTLVLAAVTWLHLADQPTDARWLRPDERSWLARRLVIERRQRRAVHDLSLRDALMNGRLWALALVWFGGLAGLYGVGFWLPQIVKEFGLSNAETGWVVAIPYAAGALGMVLYGRHSDARRERKGHVAFALLVAAAGLAASTLTRDPVQMMVAFTIGSVGVFAMMPVFWTLPTALLSGTSAAAGIAIINSVGSLSGFAGPFVMGWVKDTTGGFGPGLLLIAWLAFLAMLSVLALGHDPALERVPQNHELEGVAAE